jgi:phage minor structural protein
LCILENAFDISYTLNLNGLAAASFTLPSDDPKNAFCASLNYAELYDEGRRVELFRILPSRLRKSAETRKVVYECEHVLACLMDSVLFGFHSIGNLGVFTPSVIGYILERQTEPLWRLAECDFSRQFLYTWENENLLAALFSVANRFDEDYIWRTDTTDMGAWQVSLKRRNDSKQKGELRYRKNMRGIYKTVDPAMLATRLYCLGYGEGSNQLNFASINGGKHYIEADTVGKYGVIEKIAVDRRFHHKESLLEWGRKTLNEIKNPYISYEVTAGMEIEEEIGVGDIIRVIDDEEGISELMAVVSIRKSNIESAPEISYKVANKPKSIAESIADLSDRQRVADLYAQGATNIDSRSFSDNADAQNPAVMRFYVPHECVRVNKCLLNFRFAPFRGYSRGAAAGGGYHSTTDGGGGFAHTTDSGGGFFSSTDSGGWQSATSTAVVLAAAGVVDASVGGAGSANHNHGVPHGVRLMVDNGNWRVNSQGNVAGGTYYAFAPSGAHLHEAHSHNVSIDGHNHGVSITPHSHNVNLPPHTHGFWGWEHSHDLVHGIFAGSTAAAASLRVDGNAVGTVSQGVNIDIIPYLNKDEGGRIARGAWHTVEIVPNGLTRVEADVYSQIFVNSVGGGDF